MQTFEPQEIPEPVTAPVATPLDAPAPADEAVTPPLPTGPRPLSRVRAVLEVVLCSSYPTQILAAVALAAAGVRGGTADGGLDATFVIAMSVIDALLVVVLIVYLLRRRGESVAAVMLGGVPVAREAALGVGLVVPVTLGVALTVVGVRALWPTLHNVPVNPMTALMGDPQRVLVFALIVVLAGGVREEMQRAFQLHRLAPRVVGPWPALLLTSVAFGLGHTVQGYDVAVATFLLGALWGALWLRRRSLIASAVCHALFNLGQVAAAWAVARGAVAP